jgi:hypothetical protein
MPLARATARVVLGVDSSSLLPRQFEVETPERNLIAKTLEGQDATVSCTVVVLISLPLFIRTVAICDYTIWTLLGHVA